MLPLLVRLLLVVLQSVEGDAWLLVVLEARLLLLRDALLYSLLTLARCRPRLEPFRAEVLGERLFCSIDDAESSVLCCPFDIDPIGVAMDVGNRGKLYWLLNV